jgi:hypothetical protein
MKSILFLSIFLLIGSTGCMTITTVEAARIKTHKNQKGEVVVDQKARPGFYALIPLTVAGDVATSPFQLALILMLAMSGIQC